MNSIKAMTIEDNEIKKSRFIAILYPVLTEKDVQIALADAKTKHPGATHYCFAYILGDKAEIQKSSDDGEPLKTAGAPMLEILNKNDLTNVMAVVVRYFGGIKLGAGGLIRAYANAVKSCIKASNLTKSTPYTHCEVAVDYGSAGGMEFYLHKNADTIEKTYGDLITFSFILKTAQLNKTNEMVKKLSNFRSSIKVVSEIIRYI